MAFAALNDLRRAGKLDSFETKTENVGEKRNDAWTATITIGVKSDPCSTKREAKQQAAQQILAGFQKEKDDLYHQKSLKALKTAGEAKCHAAGGPSKTGGQSQRSLRKRAAKRARNGRGNTIDPAAASSEPRMPSALGL
eukprot:s3972_g2.t1